MLARLDLRGDRFELGAISRRGVSELDPSVVETVRAIVAAVRTRGDSALRELTERLDGVRIDDFRVPAGEIAAARRSATGDLQRALEYAHAEILAYHEAQRPVPRVQDRGGISVRDLVLPVARAGCYVPGGRAAYPSTVLMTAVPARVAGVEEIVLCIPPRADGTVAPAALAAAAVAGIDTVFRVGGAQAIAAMAYGTETIPSADVVVGPGNVYVALAKREVSGVVGVESFAGPSEIVVVADDCARPDHVAADLLAQAEHGPGGAAVLITWSAGLADAVDEALDKLMSDVARREEIEATLRDGGRCVLVDGPERALAVSNVLAPEHLELLTAEPDALVPLIRNAGAVFCGAWTPAVLGDYVVGVNHVLPTDRSARYASALRVEHFCKHIQVVSAERAALERVAPHVRALANAEGLVEHARSVTVRMDR